MKKQLQWFFCGMIILVVIYLSYLLLNAGVLLDNARTESTYLRERSDVGLLIVRRSWIGKTTADISRLSAELKSKGVIVGVEGEVFEIGDFVFDMKDGSVVEVRLIDTPQAKAGPK